MSTSISNRSIEILKRLKTALGVKTDTRLSERYGVAQPTLAGWKSRDSIDLAKTIEICEEEDLSLDWIIAGRETVPGTAADSRLREMQMEINLQAREIESLKDTIVRISQAGPQVATGFTKTAERKEENEAAG